MKQYAVVGVVEGLKKFVGVLAAMFPQVYGGALQVYPKLRLEQETKAKRYPTPTPATRALVEAYYRQETMFYNATRAVAYGKAQTCGVATFSTDDYRLRAGRAREPRPAPPHESLGLVVPIDHADAEVRA
jgi:hypothetical protein